MKRLITNLVLALTFAITFTGSALAEHYWTLEMFRPTGPITGNSFNVEYKVFSVEKNDDFSVNLFQNGSVIATQNTTKDYGDSGVFSVTVPGPGTYQYHISAQSSVDNTVKTTEDRTLTVSQTPTGTVTTVFVANQANAQQGGAAGDGVAQVAGPGGAAGGEVAGAVAAQTPGQVSAEGESATDENGDVLGTEKKNDNKEAGGNTFSNNWPWWSLAVLALGAAGYYALQKAGKNPFSRGDS